MMDADLLPCPAPCLICAKALRNFADEGGNPPLGGLEFVTRGHYGSRLFDQQAGSLIINICDDCLEDAAEKGRVLHYLPAPRQREPKGTYSGWGAASGSLRARTEQKGSPDGR